MLQIAAKPDQPRALTVRPLRVSLGPDTPRHWLADDPFETHLLNALSLTFPAGERFFMRSVQALREHVKEPALVEQVRVFLAQEALHSREHSVFNDWLETLGLPAKRIERHVEERIAARDEWRGPLASLAATCALEHFTAILAKLLLTNPELQQRFHGSMLPLWYWHAIEELDHKAVAFDVYQAAGGGYERRVAAMVLATVGLMGTALIIQWHLMGADKQRGNLRSWLKGGLRYFGPRGYLAKVLPDYLSYYRRDFHPWQHDDRALIAEAERALSRMLGAP